MSRHEWDEGSDDDSAQAYIDAKKRQGVTVSGSSTDLLFRQALEVTHGQVWDTSELQRNFTVQGFCMGHVIVIRKSDGQRGSLDFSHSPRFYYDFMKG